jgi:hypothetical protein
MDNPMPVHHQRTKLIQDYLRLLLDLPPLCDASP